MDEPKKPKERYGVFVWRQDGRYREVEAIKIYKVEAAANRFCDLDYRGAMPRNLVVRPSWIWRD